MAAETEAREAIVKAMETTFVADGFLFRRDKLHKSIGDKGTTIGCYPEVTRHANDALVSEMHLVVQFYGAYKLEVNREETVDPAVIEAYLERFRLMLKAEIETKTAHVWYYMLERVTFPEDPTGNITRFEAFIIARGSNTALKETG